MQNILVMGGSYFAGRVFLELLLNEQGYNLHVLNRGKAPLNHPQIREIVCDRQDGLALHRALPPRDWDLLVDFCAYTPQDISRLLNHLPGQVGHYVFISTCSVYAASQDLPVTEEGAKLSAPQTELGLYADYGYQKWRAEELLRQECQSRGINCTILRPAIIYGRYNYAPRESYFFDCLIDDLPVVIPENGLPLFSFCWVDDMARAILACLGTPRAFDQAFNLAAPELVSYQRIVEVLEAITGKRVQLVKLPPAEIEARKIPLPFPLDHHLIYAGRKLDQLLQFSYTPLARGLRRTLEYYVGVRRQQKASRDLEAQRAAVAASHRACAKSSA